MASYRKRRTTVVCLGAFVCIFSCILPVTFGQSWQLPFDSHQSVELSNRVKQLGSQARIVGIGECTHYTKECYQLKQTMIEALIESGFAGLVLEVDFGQALIWNDYVVNGNGDLSQIVAQSGWFTYRTEEFQSLLKMLRDHNAKAEVPFQVFGMEMTAVNHNAHWFKDFLNESGIESPEIRAALEVEQPTVAFEAHSFDQSSHYWRLSNEMHRFLQLHRETLLKSFDEKKLAIAERIAEIFRQYATYVSHSDNSLKAEFRDQFSARNVQWCVEFLGSEAKLAIWAHNGHITKSALSNYDVLGNHLNRWYGKEYYSIGFTMNQGEFGAYSSERFKRWKLLATTEPSITYQLASLKSPYVWVDVRAGLESDPSPQLWLRSESKIQRDSGESFSEDWPKLVSINLADSYDALIYIDHCTVPTTIEWKPAK